MRQLFANTGHQGHRIVTLERLEIHGINHTTALAFSLEAHSRTQESKGEAEHSTLAKLRKYNGDMGY